MSKIIIVCGLPGSGKTFFARKLALRLNAVHIGSDEVRTTAGARGRYTMNDKLHIYTEMARIAAQCIEKGRTVIADATFHHHAMRSVFVKLAQEYEVPIRLIIVEANEALVRQRLSEPRPDSEADFEVYKMIKQKFEPIATPHLTLESTQRNVQEMVDEAVRYINDQQ